MKLKIAGIESEINLDNRINVVEILDKHLFKNLVNKLNDAINYDQDVEEIILTNEDVKINMNKNMQIIIDPFNIDFNSKDILSKLYVKLDQMNTLEMVINDEFATIANKLIKYVRDIVNDLTFECSMTDKIAFKDILKILSLKIDTEQYEKLEDKIMFLIDLVSEFELCKTIVFVNLKQYIDNETAKIVYKYAISKEITILLIESTKCEKIEHENKLIIDEDFEDYIE